MEFIGFNLAYSAFLMGLWGLFYHFQRNKESAFSVLSLFLMTGLAIIIFVNQNDPQPRERDYSYVGSFFAFSIWIGIALSSIGDYVRKFFQDKPNSKYAIVGTFVFTGGYARNDVESKLP